MVELRPKGQEHMMGLPGVVCGKISEVNMAEILIRYSWGMNVEYQKWSATSAAKCSSEIVPKIRSKIMLRQTIGKQRSLTKMLRFPEKSEGRELTVRMTCRRSPEATNASEKSVVESFSFLGKFSTSIAGIFPHKETPDENSSIPF